MGGMNYSGLPHGIPSTFSFFLSNSGNIRCYSKADLNLNLDIRPDSLLLPALCHYLCVSYTNTRRCRRVSGVMRTKPEW